MKGRARLQESLGWAAFVAEPVLFVLVLSVPVCLGPSFVVESPAHPRYWLKASFGYREPFEQGRYSDWEELNFGCFGRTRAQHRRLTRKQESIS